jgi:putative transposase
VSRRFVSEHAGEYPVTRLCALVEIPRSSFYEWNSRPLSKHYLDDVELANEIYEIHVASRRTYGAPRVSGQLHNRGRHHGRKRVARIMVECGLVGVHGRKKWRRGKRDSAPAGDLLHRDFTAERSNRRWSPTSPSSPAETASSTSPASKTSAIKAWRAGRWVNARPPTSS